MKINSNKFFISCFVLLIFLQLYLVSFKINILIQIVTILLFFILDKPFISVRVLKTILPLILIFILGFIGSFIHQYKLLNILKDIFHFIKPILGIAIGYFFFKKINNFILFIKIIVVCGVISAFIHFWIILFLNHGHNTLASLREFSKDNFLELFALFFLVFYKEFQKKSLFKKSIYYYLFVITLLISLNLYASRTMIVAAIIIILTIYGYTIITRKSIKILGIITILIIILYVYLFSIKLERDTFAFKIRNAPSELFKTKIDRENHAELWDHWRGYEAARAFDLMQKNPSSFIFGTGYGSLVNLKFFAPLTDNMKIKGLKYISELHNGYPYLLYKTGMIGLVLYIYFLYNLYKKVYFRKNFTALFLSAIGLIFIFTTLTITGMYNTREVIIFILGGLLYFQEKIIKND